MLATRKEKMQIFFQHVWGWIVRNVSIAYLWTYDLLTHIGSSVFSWLSHAYAYMHNLVAKKTDISTVATDHHVHTDASHVDEQVNEQIDAQAISETADFVQHEEEIQEIQEIQLDEQNNTIQEDTPDKDLQEEEVNNNNNNAILDVVDSIDSMFDEETIIMVSQLSQSDFADWVSKQSLDSMNKMIGDFTLGNIENFLGRQPSMRLFSYTHYQAVIADMLGSYDERVLHSYRIGIDKLSTKYELGMSGIKALKAGFFEINNGEVSDKNWVSKGCVLLRDPIVSMSMERVEKLLLLLQKKRFVGQCICIPDETVVYKLYSLLLYGTSRQMVDMALRIVAFSFGEEVLYTDLFTDKQGMSHLRRLTDNLYHIIKIKK